MCYPSNGKLKNKVECPSLAIKQIGAFTVGGERSEEQSTQDTSIVSFCCVGNFFDAESGS